ncbi:MAG: phosphatase PAP2 family protein [Pseudomonadota bacterium]
MKEIFYDWGGLNVWLFHAINNIRFEYLDRLMLLGTLLGDHKNFTLFLALVTLLGVLELASIPVQDALRYQRQAMRWLTAVAVLCIAYLLDSWIISALKPLLDFPRPPLALSGLMHVVGQPEYHHSLPSGHTAFAVLTVASLWPILSSGWRVVGVAFAIWVGLSRVSLGAHFPADVVAGAVLSLLLVWLVRGALKLLVRRYSAAAEQTT